MNTKPLIPFLVKLYQSDKKYQYTGLFSSTFAAIEDAKARFGMGIAFATPINQSRGVKA
ncbi:hypothetical protein [Nitrosomonas sp. HPC101]|uniref:hypothetical protein n=1 Tax=Nitrosomonas sp. HPC101 TaxID=1658667 RepID=UPI0013711CF8|nr:hypothetical protein [Nitrosomonas sp. HPC101]